jgi:hypothetical protein
MTKGNFLRYYNRLTGADRTLVFFERNGYIYIYNCKHIAPRWVHEERESSSKGGWQKFRMYIPAAEKDKLVAKGAIPVMTSEEFAAISYNNKGHKCEAWLHKTCNLGKYTSDNRRFDKCGDVTIDGIQYQVKFENATLTNVNVLHKAQKDARGK